MFTKIDTITSLLFDCQCVIFLLDITNKISIDNLELLIQQIDFSDFHFLKIFLVENKIDKNREISEDKIKEFMKQNRIRKNMKISIKNGTGIEDLANEIKNYVDNLTNNIPINFSSQNKEKNLNEKIDTKGMKTVNIIFIGNSTVGKTCLFLRIDRNHYETSFLSTIGIDIHSKLFQYKNEIYNIIICDTAGQDRYRTLPKKYYINADGVFLLFDLTNKSSFNDVSIWMNELKTNIGYSGGKEKGPVVYLIGNKLDELDRVITREEAEEKANFYDIKYFEMSCKLNINIQEIFSRMIVECSQNISEKKTQTSFQIKTEKDTNKKKKNIHCC